MYLSPYLPVIDSETLDELELPESAGQVDLVGQDEDGDVRPRENLFGEDTVQFDGGVRNPCPKTIPVLNEDKKTKDF